MILELRDNHGLTLQEIGDNFNISRERVRQVLLERFDYAKGLSEIRKKLITHYDEMKTNEEIAKILNLSEWIVSKYRKDIVKNRS